MPAVTAAANASVTPNLYIIVGTRAGVVYRYEKGSFPPASTFAIASASKVVASATIQRLVDRGVMRLDDAPQRYLSYWTSNGIMRWGRGANATTSPIRRGAQARISFPAPVRSAGRHGSTMTAAIVL